jgi:hypothetical protein
MFVARHGEDRCKFLKRETAAGRQRTELESRCSDVGQAGHSKPPGEVGNYVTYEQDPAAHLKTLELRMPKHPIAFKSGRKKGGF